MKRSLWILLLLLILALAAAARPAAAQTPPPPEELTPVIEEALGLALRDASGAKSLQQEEPFDGYGVMVEQVFYSEDRTSALLWLSLIDPATQQIIETEPATAIALLNGNAKDPTAWQIVFPTEPNFVQQVEALPEEIETAEFDARLVGESADTTETKGVPLYGYKLPWAGGTQVRLSGSISHFLSYKSCSETTCRYAYDFANGTMFPLLASKGGNVVFFYDDCANGDVNCTNSLALEDLSTTPATYQIYLHLAKDTIPSALQRVGAPVQQGQFIGNADDTGYSSGHHLHYHVTSALRYYYDNGGHKVAWGNSIDIRFDDVDINNGVPRTCVEAANTSWVNTYGGSQCKTGNLYTSGNWGAFPPSGNITSPAANTTLTNATLRVTATASDDQGVTRVQALANINGAWKELGAPLTLSGSTYAGDINLCEANVPKGSFELALRIWDKEGNQTLNYPGRRTLNNQAACKLEADIRTPTFGQSLTDTALAVSGAASSSTGIQSVTVIARQNGPWQSYPATLSGDSFSTSINLCQAGFTPGPLTLALRVLDKQGETLAGLPGLRTIVNNSRCTPPPKTCQPGSGQVALYADPNFGGACTVLGPGNYASASSLWPLPDNQVESIRLGANAHLILYESPSYTGRSESFEIPAGMTVSSDANLADNIIGGDRVSSLKVLTVSTNNTIFPAPPAPTLINPSSALGRTPTSVDSLVLSWTGGDGATVFQSRLHRTEDGSDSSQDKILTWQKTNSFPVGNLRAGTYSWFVMGGNHLGQTSERRSAYPSIQFTVTSAALANPAAINAPLSDTLNAPGGWTTSGQWRHGALDETRTGFAFNNGTDYTGAALSGDLTSVPINIPAGASYLQFDYLAETETNRPLWDQRRVQISVAGAAFTDLAVLTTDAYGAWLTSEPINLSAYAGKLVRLRFHFSALDSAYNNAGRGWMIDAVRIVSGAAANPCPEASPNNTWPTATSINLNSTTAGVICPGGDLDYYRIVNAANRSLALSVLANRSGSPLDPILTLLDENGNLILENDDLVIGEIRDPQLAFTPPDNQPYFLRVQAWDHPLAGGTDFTYQLSVMEDNVPPNLTITAPRSAVSSLPVQISAEAGDNTAVQRVDFYIHSSDWENGSWELVGSDFNPAGGWSFTLTSEQAPNGIPAVIYVEAVDAAGNRSGVVKTGPRVFIPFVAK